MKEIVVSPKVLRRELWILLACFLFAVLFDLFAIVKYGRPFGELFRTIGYILAIMVVVYLALALLRLLVFVICRLFGR
ncbi:MAG: hypothetical protein IJ654_07775 [Bacteroidales bacterium]|nr:hypothetical protein [Bacteroidales bacterium]